MDLWWFNGDLMDMNGDFMVIFHGDLMVIQW